MLTCKVADYTATLKKDGAREVILSLRDNCSGHCADYRFISEYILNMPRPISDRHFERLAWEAAADMEQRRIKTDEIDQLFADLDEGDY